MSHDLDRRESDERGLDWRERATLSAPVDDGTTVFQRLYQVLSQHDLAIRVYPDEDFKPQDIPQGQEVVQRCNFSLECHVTFEIRAEPDGPEFHAWVPGMKGVHVGGSTMDETWTNAAHAIAAYINSYARHNRPVQTGPEFTVEARQGLEVQRRVVDQQRLIGP